MFKLFAMLLTVTCLIIFQPAYSEEPTFPPTESDAETVSEDASSSTSDFDEELDEDMVVAKGDNVIWNDQLVHLHGNAYIKYQDIILEADDIYADFDTNLLQAVGHVHLRIEQEDTYANELIYNLETKKGVVKEGVAYNAPWYYQGAEIFKVEDKESLINDASLTTCPLKHPHFYFQASKIIVHVNKELIAKHVTLKIGGIPLLYLPVYRRDLREEKRSRVIVKIGTESYQGNYIQVIVPVAREKRYDGAVDFEYTSRRGTGFGTDGKYNVRDVKFKEIVVHKPPKAKSEERTAAKERAEEILKRLEGEFNKYHLKQIFFEYQIDESDIQRVQAKAEEVHAQAIKADADFAALARQHSDDQKTKYQGGDLGFLMEGEGKLAPELEDIAFQLQEGQVSDIIRTEDGFHILKVEQFMDEYGVHEIKVRHILIAIQASDDTKKLVQETAKKVHEQLQMREATPSIRADVDFDTPSATQSKDFDEMVEAYSDDVVSKEQGGDLGWVGLDEMESNQWYAVRDLEPGAISDTVQTDKGVYIFKVLEKEETPSFEDVARQSSEGDTAEDGGEKSFKGPGEEPRVVIREGQRLDSGEMSKVIETSKDYRIIKVEKKRTYNGNLRFFTGDIYSYERTNSVKIGRRLEFRHSHRHVFYTPWDNREAQRGGLTFMGRTTYSRRSYMEDYPPLDSQLRTSGTFTWGSALAALSDRNEDGRLLYPSTILARLNIDKSFDFTGEGSLFTQKLPELTISWLGIRLNRLPLFKKMNAKMKSISKKVKNEKVPLLGFPTLDNIRFSIDSVLGNYFRDKYRQEENIYLHTADIGFDVQKQSAIEFWPNRELHLDVGVNGDFIWYDKDREGRRNIAKFLFSTRSAVRNTMFHIYDISFIPNARKLRHQIETELLFNYTPPVAREEDLYPFGPNAYLYERKKLTFRLRTDIRIKTRGDTDLSLFSFNTSVARDFTYKKDGQTSSGFYSRREYDDIYSTLNITPLPSRNLRISARITHDPNESDEDGKRFKMKRFQSTLDYSRGTYTKGWGFNFGNQYYKYYQKASRNFIAGFNYRPGRSMGIDVDVTYDWVAKDFYSQRIVFRRNLHDWDLRISWRRTGLSKKDGVSKGYVSKDFTFQINLIADPSATVGLGYDAYTKTWGLQSLPVGMPYGGFGSSRLGRSYF